MSNQQINSTVILSEAESPEIDSLPTDQNCFSQKEITTQATRQWTPIHERDVLIIMIYRTFRKYSQRNKKLVEKDRFQKWILNKIETQKKTFWWKENWAPNAEETIGDAELVSRKGARARTQITNQNIGERWNNFSSSEHSWQVAFQMDPKKRDVTVVWASIMRETQTSFRATIRFNISPEQNEDRNYSRYLNTRDR